jgi:hypothetical protein
LRTEPQNTQNAPHIGLAKAHTVHALNDGPYPFKSSQRGTKSVLRGALH